MHVLQVPKPNVKVRQLGGRLGATLGGGGGGGVKVQSTKCKQRDCDLPQFVLELSGVSVDKPQGMADHP